MRSLTLVLVAFVGSSVFAKSPPHQPDSPRHPGSSVHFYKVRTETFSFEGRKLKLYTPAGSRGRAPLVVWGHGYRVPFFAYAKTMEHLATKGVASLMVDYSTGWEDHDFQRMARDYMRQTAAIFKIRSSVLNPNAVIFSGHSNGAYVALLAAGLPAKERYLEPRAVVPIAVAGARKDYLARLNPDIAVSFVIGDEDSVEYSTSVFEQTPIKRKQLIVVSSYRDTFPQLIADHGFCRTIDWFAPLGRDNALHYYGLWKFLVGAAWDAAMGAHYDNPYIYGDETSSTGDSRLSHTVTKNW